MIAIMIGLWTNIIALKKSQAEAVLQNLLLYVCS